MGRKTLALLLALCMVFASISFLTPVVAEANNYYLTNKVNSEKSYEFLEFVENINVTEYVTDNIEDYMILVNGQQYNLKDVNMVYDESKHDSLLEAIRDGNLQPVTVNQNQPAPQGLEAVAPSIYNGSDGKIIGTTADMEYRLLSEENWTGVSGSEIQGLSAGYYDVRYKAKEGFNEGIPTTITVPIGPHKDQPAPVGLQGIAPSSFGGSDGKIIGTSSEMEYRSTSVETWTDVNGSEISGLEAGWYDVRYKAKEGYNEGLAATVGIEPGPNEDQAPPEGLQGVAPSTFGGSDGKITGTTSEMEYYDGSTWLEVTGSEISGLQAGWYDVRYAAKAGFNEGLAATIHVPVPENQDQTAPQGLEGIAPSTFGGTDGKITGTTAEMEYRSTSVESWTPVTGAEITGLATGWYDVRYAAKDGFNPSSPATIGVPAPENEDQIAPQGLEGIAPSTFGGTDGKITGTTADMEYRSTSVETWTDVTGSEISGLEAGWYDVRYKAKAGYNEGAAATIGVPPGEKANQGAPVGLTTLSPTSFGGSDGKIIGTTDEMEYRLLSEQTWREVSGSEISGLSAGYYDVRYAAKEGFNASEALSVQIKEGEARLQAITVDGVALANFSADQLTYNIELSSGTSLVPTVMAAARDGNAPVVITPALALPGETTILVTAENGTSTREYKINFIIKNPVPVGLKGVAPTSSGGNDGRITGTSSGMEYKPENSVTWIQVSGPEITGLLAGSYLVRYSESPGYTVGTPANVVVPHLDSGKLIFTFDDGWKDTITLGKPILDTAGFKATVYVNKDLTQIAEYNWSQYHVENVMDYDDLHELYNHGWDVSNHSANHLDFKRNAEGKLVGLDNEPLEWQTPEEYGAAHPDLDQELWYTEWLKTLVAIGSDPDSVETMKRVYLDNQNWLSGSGPDGLGKEVNGVWVPGRNLNMPLSAYHVAYPSGLYSPELIDMLKSIGVKTGRATIETGIKNNIMNPVTDFFNLPVQYVETELVNGEDENLVDVKESIDYAVEHGTTVILMIHRVGPPGDLFVTEESFQSIVDYAKNFTQAGTLDVMTISQWYNMLK